MILLVKNFAEKMLKYFGSLFERYLNLLFFAGSFTVGLVVDYGGLKCLGNFRITRYIIRCSNWWGFA